MEGTAGVTETAVKKGFPYKPPFDSERWFFC
jgi:hypothetical protein